MPYIAMRPGKFAGTQYFIGDTIPDSAVDPKRAAWLESAGLIKDALVTADRASLEAKIVEVAAIAADGYTADSYKVLADALAQAKDLISDAGTTQAQLDAQLGLLTDAVKALVKAKKG